MTGFDLPQNFHFDPVIASSSAPRAMAQKTLRDYSALSANQVPTGPEVNTGGENFEVPNDGAG